MTPRPLTETPALADLACRLLRTPSAMLAMSEAEIRQVVQRMHLIHIPRGTVVFREGAPDDPAHLLLLLAGEVVVETGHSAGVPASVLGPGNIIGEMSLLDGSPRSSTCTAASAVQAAGLSREALEALVEQEPRVGAKLMVALTNRMAERLRALADQLRLYAQITPQDAPTVRITLRPPADSPRADG
ncbi:MAG: cyclic nucleotide-binding domain-containing protein [Burkholderiales bacterium]|nr:cyclic nucleotide-binding domain-containing protein [Burkholderiales bacterium]